MYYIYNYIYMYVSINGGYPPNHLNLDHDFVLGNSWGSPIEKETTKNLSHLSGNGRNYKSPPKT